MSALIVAVLLMSSLRSDFSLEMDGWTEDKSDEKDNQPARKKLKLSLKKRCKRNWKDQRETSTSMKRSLRRWLEMVSTSLATSAELK